MHDLSKYMQFLSVRLGPYPFSTNGVILLPDEVRSVSSLMAGSAFETTTIPVFGPDSESDPATFIHEMAHQWMGNCVSVTHWGDDIWWVEGFAKYSEWLLTEMVTGKEAHLKQVMATYRHHLLPRLTGSSQGIFVLKIGSA